MDSDFHNQQQQQPQQFMNTGLTRYRSAPSSYFSNFVSCGMFEEETVDPFFNPQVSSPETERILSRYMSNCGRGDNLSLHHNLGEIQGVEPQFMDSVKQEHATFSSLPQSQSQQQQHMIYQNDVQALQADHNNSSVISGSNSTLANPLTVTDSPTNLLRKNSLPAGYFEHNNIDGGYSMMRPMDKFRTAIGSLPDSLPSSKNRLKSRMYFSPGPHSSSGLLSHIPENEGKTMIHKNGGFRETSLKADAYASSFPGGSWEEPTMLNDGFLTIHPPGKQNDDGRIHVPTSLTHHLSLPTSSTELSVMEKLLQFQDIVPLRSRAKRGCATHPRSIAERVRRTRISERMRKLQELVPNMDKQTNTSDMLDLAVDYIKELQKQVETLSNHHARCACPNKRGLL